ncbi:hypothetical protein TPHA_0H03080 [Tetrapisispora phaffii CBS 4417]|uniref:Calnexin n=1 Tax=Tetrapisispora phaffii (strain ATCC 24235 / CBS 4417 / NBRC 1672 / NRRL Y-8282 / UCD 70-5) TaxID=1071381 RepID=G8BWR0_TETPH|nr:hypothetical protein TPHA_0H03080 [Tetrapisispora phaffii CBS 4417]CCE64511.1 hypothetical protein TPHA_0H03080 [Tetrapisispora phaffii CBS 4417]
MSNIKFLVALLAAASVATVSADKNGSGYKFEHPAIKEHDFKLADDSFFEDFQGYDSEKAFRKKWISSKKKINDRYSDELVEQYPVKWGLEEAYIVPGFVGDKSLVTYTDKGFGMIGTVFKKPIVMEDGDDLVIQYETKIQTALECGGAFIKLLPPIKKSQLKKYGGEDSPTLELIFGPDNCAPYTNEVHLGFRRHNPISNKTELVFFEKAPESRLGEDLKSHLYTLRLNGKTQDFELRFDGEVTFAANLLDEGVFDPPFGGPKMIPDPNAVQPETWDDRKTIPDPSKTKPKTWDDRAVIPDPEAKKPEKWDESIPKYIPDPERTKQPEWWNEEADGEWVAPLITNPSCDTEFGCGEWTAELISNPDYKGLWEQPMIENPDYMGVWEPELIKNPEHYEDSTPSKLSEPVGGILFEFYSGSIDLLFDNIYVGKSIKEAEMIGNATFKAKRELEDKELALGGGVSVPLDNETTQKHKRGDNEDKLKESDGALADLFIAYTKIVPPYLQGLGVGLILVVLVVGAGLIVLTGVNTLKTGDERRTAKATKTAEAKEKEPKENKDEKVETEATSTSVSNAVVEEANETVVEEDEDPEEVELRLRKKMIGISLEIPNQ